MAHCTSPNYVLIYNDAACGLIRYPEGTAIYHPGGFLAFPDGSASMILRTNHNLEVAKIRESQTY